jgi:hypothetical protein
VSGLAYVCLDSSECLLAREKRVRLPFRNFGLIGVETVVSTIDEKVANGEEGDKTTGQVAGNAPPDPVDRFYQLSVVLPPGQTPQTISIIVLPMTVES